MTGKGIHSNRCWLDGQLQQATVFIENGVISGIKKGEQNDFDGVENIGDAVLMPGVIDAHVHVNEPGRTAWEGFDTATQAAAAGGITTIVDMPLNASPVTISLKALQEKLEATKGKLYVNCGFYGGLIPGNGNSLEELMRGGVPGIKAFVFPDESHCLALCLADS